MLVRLRASGGCTAGLSCAEAEVIAGSLLAPGIPPASLILETQATNTSENVMLGRARVAQAMKYRLCA